MANQYGRPMKGRTRRFPITVNVEQGTLEEIDKFVETRQQEGPYSRSDFYEEAAALLLQQKSGRTKNVP